MPAGNKQTLDRVVAESCLKLFADYQLEIRPRGPDNPAELDRFILCGIIGFTSEKMRGALVLATTQEPLDRTNPVTPPQHRDWVSELSNQLLGRVKNQLLGRGVVIQCSTPIALRGEPLSPVLQRTLVADVFTAEGGVICVWVDCEFDEGFTLPEPLHSVTPAVSEGETILF